MRKTVRRIEAVALAWLALMLTLLATGCGSAADTSRTTPSIGAVVTPSVEAPQVAGPTVRVEGDLTPLARVGESVVLELSVSNLGPRDIQDLTIVVNDAYLAEMVGVEATPNAIRYNQMGGEYFAFSTLPKGATGHYVIRMSPDTVGDFTAKVDVAEWSASSMAPLPDADGGAAEYLYETRVLPR